MYLEYYYLYKGQLLLNDKIYDIKKTHKLTLSSIRLNINIKNEFKYIINMMLLFLKFINFQKIIIKYKKLNICYESNEFNKNRINAFIYTFINIWLSSSSSIFEKSFFFNSKNIEYKNSFFIFLNEFETLYEFSDNFIDNFEIKNINLSLNTSSNNIFINENLSRIFKIPLKIKWI